MNLPSKLVKWELIENVEKLASFKDEWNKLCLQTNDSFFISPEWILNWISVFWQDDWQLKVILGFEDDKLSVILPFYIQTSGFLKVKTLYPLGQGEQEEAEISSEYQDILICKNTKIRIKEIAQQLNKIKFNKICWHALLADSNLLKSTPFVSKLQPINSGSRYAIDGQIDPKKFLSKNNYSSWRKSYNKLKNIEAKFSWVSFNETSKYWEKMKQLHQNRWNKNGKSGAFLHDQFSQFHLLCAKQNNIKISTIEVNNTPIAINYYYEANNTLYFYQCGWNIDEYANFSPGFALHVWSIQNSPCIQYDFMMGKKNNSYKNKFGCNIIDNMYNIQTESIVKKLYRYFKNNVIGKLNK